MTYSANHHRNTLLRLIVPSIFIATWWLPKPYNFHLLLDQMIAKGVQIPLELSDHWQFFCAFLNADIFDAFMYVAIIAHGTWALSKIPSFQKGHEIKRLFIYYLLLSIAQFIFKYLLHTACHFHRLSPSLSLIDAARICPDAIGFYFKDSSRRSFPGDHALFLFSWAMFWTRGYGKKIVQSAFAIALFFSFPRLLVGGHWLSDLTLGGIIPAWLFAKLILKVDQKYWFKA